MEDETKVVLEEILKTLKHLESKIDILKEAIELIQYNEWKETSSNVWYSSPPKSLW